MIQIGKYIKGDKVIWALALLMALLSFLAVYSASSHMALKHETAIGTIVLKHLFFLVTGFSLMYMAHSIPYRYFGGIAVIMLPMAMLLLALTLLQGGSSNGTNDSRWLNFMGLSFQTSTFASLVLYVYVARYLSRNLLNKPSLKNAFFPLLLPIALVCALILPANLSTAVIVFFTSLVLMFVGHFPLKNMLFIILIGLGSLLGFVLLVKAFPQISNRVDTWQGRLEAYWDGPSEKSYQVQKAHLAIAQGGLLGMGAGKSTQKNFLPQSNSDFIYAIIVEEYGLLGGLFVLALFIWLFVRILKTATKAPTVFGSLLTVAAGSGIMLQAFINMGVAVSIFPVTGQTLPLISQGGTAIWMNCLALGIILSVSRAERGEEIPMADETKPEFTASENPQSQANEEAIA